MRALSETSFPQFCQLPLLHRALEFSNPAGCSLGAWHYDDLRGPHLVQRPVHGLAGSRAHRFKGSGSFGSLRGVAGECHTLVSVCRNHPNPKTNPSPQDGILQGVAADDGVVQGNHGILRWFGLRVYLRNVDSLLCLKAVVVIVVIPMMLACPRRTVP